MSKGYRWVVVVLALALLVVGCGPEMVSTTPETRSSTDAAPSTTEREESEATPKPESGGETVVDPDDWRSLGSADAPVTIVEYSDFQ